MKNLMVILIALTVASCGRLDASVQLKQATPSGRTIVVAASVELELVERQGSFKERGPDGKLTDAPAPMKATGRMLLCFKHAGRYVSIHCPVNVHATLLQPCMVTLRVTGEDQNAQYTILKIEKESKTVYSKPNDGS